MNLPNKLTLLRIILIPFFLLALYLLPNQYNNLVAAVVFAIASITDYFDGYLARRDNLVTDFGKFMDPLADKLLVATALIYFVEVNLLPAYIVIIIIGREFLITGFRVIAANKGVVLAASWYGKIKTALTMFMIIIFLLELPFGFMPVINLLLVIAVTFFTVMSAVDYLAKNIKVLDLKDI